MIDFRGEIGYNGASEQVLGTHEIATVNGGFSIPVDNFIPVRRKARRSMLLLSTVRRCSDPGFQASIERRALRVLEATR